MALRTVTVKSAGGDYGSLNAAASGEEADLVALDRQLVIECYNFEDTAGRAFFESANYTVDATHYLTVTAPVGQRHDGKWSTSGYRMKVSGGWASGVNTQLAYTRLLWLQVEDNMTVASGAGFSVTGENCVVDGCITKFTGVATAPKGFQVGPAANGTWLRNCLAHDYRNGSGGRGFSVSTDTAGELELDNCGAQNCFTGFAETFQAPILKNCWAQGCDDGFGGTWHADSDYNISDLAADAPGANSKNSTDIEFVDATDDDFHLADTDLGALNSGVDLSGTFTDDINGRVRTGKWDIGPDQLVPVYPGANAEQGGTITVGGGVRPRQGDMASATVRLEVLDDAYEFVEVLIDDVGYSFTDEDFVSWETINGSAITFTVGAGLDYVLRGTITDANGNRYTIDSWIGNADYPAVGDVEDGVDYARARFQGTFEEPGVANVKDGVFYGADGTEFEGTYDPQASVSIPIIGSVTAVGTTITVPVTNVAGKTCFVWLKDTDGTEIDEQSRSGNGDVALTIDALGKTIIVEAASYDASRSAFSEPAAKRVYVASSGSANEVLAHVIDVLQANTTLVALLASSADIRRADQPIGKAFPQITMRLVDDPDLALDDTDDVRTVTITCSAWGYVQDDLASILQQVDVSLYDNRGMESTSWLVAMSRRIGSQEAAMAGFIKDSDGRTLHQVVFTYQLRIMAK